MRKFVISTHQNGVKYGTFTHFDRLNVRHGISTRVGGTSQHPYATLNLGLHTNDSTTAVVNNRRIFCDSIGVSFNSLVTTEQTHSDNIAVISLFEAGRGHALYEEAIKNTDALITNVPNIPLMLFFADCVPVLIVDPVCNVVGIAHAGWKGTVAKIAQKTVLRMQAEFGTQPEDCLIGIGPSIGPCCYEVDQTVVAKVKQNFVIWEKLVSQINETKWNLDLWLANREQLKEIGVKDSNIVCSGLCTACNTDLFFSHRAERGVTGRLGAVIALTNSDQ